MVVKRTAEQTRANGVPQHATLFCRVLKVSFVGSEFHGLTATVEFKRPCAGVDVRFELELASQPRPDGTDALLGFVSLALGVDKHGLETTDGDGGFIHHVHNHLNDVLVVVVNFHQTDVKWAFKEPARALWSSLTWAHRFQLNGGITSMACPFGLPSTQS